MRVGSVYSSIRYILWDRMHFQQPTSKDMQLMINLSRCFMLDYPQPTVRWIGSQVINQQFDSIFHFIQLCITEGSRAHFPKIHPRSRRYRIVCLFGGSIAWRALRKTLGKPYWKSSHSLDLSPLEGGSPPRTENKSAFNPDLDRWGEKWIDWGSPRVSQQKHFRKQTPPLLVMAEVVNTSPRTTMYYRANIYELNLYWSKQYG